MSREAEKLSRSRDRGFAVGRCGGRIEQLRNHRGEEEIANMAFGTVEHDAQFERLDTLDHWDALHDAASIRPPPENRDPRSSRRNAKRQRFATGPLHGCETGVINFWLHPLPGDGHEHLIKAPPGVWLMARCPQSPGVGLRV